MSVSTASGMLTALEVNGVSPILLFLFYVASFYLASRFLVKPTAYYFLNRVSTHVARPFSRLIHYLVVIAGTGVGLSASGYGNVLAILGAILAAGTFAIGFALRDTLAAFVAGIFIFIDEPFKIGDWIEWDTHKGKVVDITIRTTKVETFNNELLTVPNDKLTNSVVKNPVANNKLRVTATFGIGYEDDIEDAKYHVHDILNEIPDILDDPAPDVKVTELAESTVNIVARYWVEPRHASTVNVKDELIRKVKTRFEEEGISLPYPTRTLAGDTLRIKKE